MRRRSDRAWSLQKAFESIVHLKQVDVTSPCPFSHVSASILNQQPTLKVFRRKSPIVLAIKKIVLYFEATSGMEVAILIKCHLAQMGEWPVRTIGKWLSNQCSMLQPLLCPVRNCCARQATGEYAPDRSLPRRCRCPSGCRHPSSSSKISWAPGCVSASRSFVSKGMQKVEEVLKGIGLAVSSRGSGRLMRKERPPWSRAPNLKLLMSPKLSSLSGLDPSLPCFPSSTLRHFAAADLLNNSTTWPLDRPS